MAYPIYSHEIDVNTLFVYQKDKESIIKALWKPGEFRPHENKSFVTRFFAIRDPVGVARRARAYVALVKDVYVDKTTFTPEYAIIANKLFRCGFTDQQVHDIAQTPANVEVRS
jgi:hypothetical protein